MGKIPSKGTKFIPPLEYFQGLEDVIREIMQTINNFSRQRGRVIEFRELLYGYSRLNTIYGHDLILDLLLVYKKYRGKKMTVPGETFPIQILRDTHPPCRVLSKYRPSKRHVISE